MITYRVITDSLLSRLAPLGWCHVDGKPHADDERAAQAIIDAYTLADYKAERKAEASAIAKRMRDAIVARVSPGELAAWATKRAEAEAYHKVGALAETPMLTAEASARGKPLSDVATRVRQNAAAYAALEASIAGVDGKHHDAIEAMTTWAQVQAHDLSGHWPSLP